MASESEKRPKKGILKTSSSFDTDGHNDVPSHKQAKWDEMNILATYHPADKDYGHMKIDEPPTPYNHDSGAEGEMDQDLEPEEGKSQLDPENLADRLKGSTDPKVLDVVEDVSSDEDLNETEEERAKRNVFEHKRKLHYNEFQAVKLARQLLEEDDDDDEGGKSPEKSDDGENL